MSSGRLVVVSNRLPITVEAMPASPQIRPSSGGLVTALEPVLRRTGGCWIGWTGTDYDPALGALMECCSPPNCTFVPVYLTAAERASFYRGCSNEILWPLFHDFPTRCRFDLEYWSAYGEVNEKFADMVEHVWEKDDFVWVHDYHLMMLGKALRTRGLRARIGYFHHIPFPAPDLFEKLPWREEILRALLQFNTIGFQTVRDRRNFVACLRRHLTNVHVRCLGERLLVGAEGHCTIAGVSPASIDYDEFTTTARDNAVVEAAAALRAKLGGSKIVLGVDRLDYTKGIPERLEAFRTLLARYPARRGTVTLVQLVVPSREDIPEYKELKLSIERLVNDINREYGFAGWIPVQYMYRSVSRTDLLALYRAAHVALVTPLKDGMNLVAKEFCAAKVDEHGVLILSEFAGAATELSEGALLVNPYGTETVVSALHRALDMTDGEQRTRMAAMRTWIRTHDVFRWARIACAQGSPLSLARPRSAAPVNGSSKRQAYAIAGD